MPGPVVDSHCHLADPAFDPDRDAVIARAREAGLVRALCILASDDAAEVERGAAIQAAWPALRCATAIHPHRAGEYAGRVPDAAGLTRAAAARVGAVAIGEIGLDYHYDFAPKPIQHEVFTAQVALAVELGRPVVIHTREAFDDTAAILRAAGGVRGVMHCFTGTVDEARASLDLGFYVSLAGILTFPRAGNLRDLARFLPADRLLVETDAPYLAPVPHRGKRNEPAWVGETLRVLAEARGARQDDLAERIHANFLAFTGLPPGIESDEIGSSPR
ncbi:MAG: TatD family hydrolase [Vicinamibacterales bacterium]